MEKLVILDVLKKSIHNLLEESGFDNAAVIKDSRITQSLCSSIEAMFLHGETQTQSILSIFGKAKQSYEYNFWNFVVEFVPRDLTRTLEHRNLKLTSIGLSRVWLRYTLNESTILSYLESMIKDDRRLKRFYCKESMIRDEELMETFCGLLKSIEHVVFNLDISLPILNTWVNSDALQICGLQHHIASKSDINNDNLHSSTNLNTHVVSSENLSPSIISSHEEEILPMHFSSIRSRTSIIVPPCASQSAVEDNTFQSPESGCNISKENDTDMTIHDSDEQNALLLYEDKEDDEEELNDLGQIMNYVEDDSDENTEPEKKSLSEEVLSELSNEVQNENDCMPMVAQLDDILTGNCDDLPVEKSKKESPHVPQDSFDQLWPQNYSGINGLIEDLDVSNIDESPEPPRDNFLESSDSSEKVEIESSKVYSSLFVNRVITSTSDFMNTILPGRFPFNIFRVKATDQSWEFIGDELISRNAELKKLIDLYPGVTESSARLGENSVFGGQCHKCKKALETNKVFFDYYDGQLYCFDCESNVKSVIPRDVISNWDFSPKSVSQSTKMFISQIMVLPNINLVTNPCLFEVVPELARVRQLRHKLSLLWMQVTSCDMETSTRVRQAMFPREYMLASVVEKDLYSLEDLIILQSGVLEKTLLHVIDKIALPHVNKCPECRMKAMACDKCRDDNNLIYIHEIDNYCECSTPLCQSVVHMRCKKSTTRSFYCQRCVKYLENQQPITLASYDTADMND